MIDPPKDAVQESAEPEELTAEQVEALAVELVNDVLAGLSEQMPEDAKE